MGLILPQTVKVKISSSNWKHFESFGYEIPKKIGYEGMIVADKYKYITVNVLDLPYRSKIKVQIQCDYCGEFEYMEYYKVYKQMHGKLCNKIVCTNKDCKKEKYSECNRLNQESIHKIENTSYLDKDWLYNQYIILDKSAENISKELSVDLRTIRKYISLSGFTIKADVIKKDNICTKEILEELYINQRLTTIEIGNKLGIGDNTVGKYLDFYDIEKFSKADQLKQRYDYKGGREKAREKYGTMEHRIKLSCGQRHINIEDFDGFVINEKSRIRNSSEYFEWRTKVFQRDKYVCQCCGRHTRDLNAHHIENFSSNENLRFNVNNGITLCYDCHSHSSPTGFHKIYGRYNNTKEQLDEFLLNYKKEAV